MYTPFMLCIITIYLFIISTLCAVEINLDARSNEIHIKVSNCYSYETMEITKALADWQRKLGISAGQPICSNNSRVILNQLIPTHLLKTILRSSKINGPNCWNSTLMANKLLPTLRFSSAEEMSLYMNSPLCQKVENLEAGDIIAIRNQKDEEIHGMIYLTPNLVLSKNGPYHARTLGFYPNLQDGTVEPLYKVSKKCRGEKKESCKQYSNYFRCQTMKSYIESNFINPQLLAVRDQLNEQATIVEARTFWLELLGDNTRWHLRDIERVLKNDIQAISQSEQFLKKALLIRIPLLIKQFEAHYLSPSMAIYGFNSDVDE